MDQTNLTADNTIFIVLSFEGPDLYSLAGGLGVRVTNLATTLASLGYPTHLFYIGDPAKDGLENIDDRLFLHRWCQWVSKYYPKGVYEGEWDKVNDFNRSIPSFIVENIALPANKQDKHIVVLGEEWHTARTMSLLGDALNNYHLRDKAVLFWNANNTFGFNNIDWHNLKVSSKITTVSRYMKHIMHEMGLNPLVIPNGIPTPMLDPINEQTSDQLRNILHADDILAKVARWDPDKSWDTAIDTIYNLRANGRKVSLLARGGIEPYGDELLHNARSVGLDVTDVFTSGENIDDYFKALSEAADAEIINIRFHCPPQFLRLIYHTADAVLANSRHEPFGLVGLETMAAGGVAITGGTGEDYATPFYNSIVLEDPDATEIEDSIRYLDEHPGESARIRANARDTARYFTWERVVELLIRKLEFQARIQGLLTPDDIFRAYSELEVMTEHQIANIGGN